MFRHILNSLPKQAQEALAGQEGKDELHSSTTSTFQEPANVRAALEQLAELKFSREDCKEALLQTGNVIEDAALWLTMNAVQSVETQTRSSSAVTSVDSEQTNFFPGTSVSFSTVQIKTSCISLVIIDDCKDADCPLLELNLASLNLKQRQEGSGSLRSRISAAYYNR